MQVETRRLLWRKAFISYPLDELSPIEFAKMYQGLTQIIGTRWLWILRLKNGKDIRGSASRTQTAADALGEAWWQVYAAGSNRLPWALGAGPDEIIARPLHSLSNIDYAVIHYHLPRPQETQWAWSVRSKDGQKIEAPFGEGSRQRAIDMATAAWWRLEGKRDKE